MRTHIDIDQDLLREAQELSGHKTKKAVVNEALTEFVRIRRQCEILDLFGTIDYDPEFDYKAQRSRR